MFTLDRRFLEDAGLVGLSDADAARTLTRLHDELELRVSRELSVRMSRSQQEEIKGLVDAGDKDALFRWIDLNLSWYSIVVSEQLSIVLQLLAAGVSAAAMRPAPLV